MAKNEKIKKPEDAIEEGTRALIPIQERAIAFIEKAKMITKIRTQAEREAVAALLVTNKDLQAEIKRVFKPMKEATHAAHAEVCARENEQLDPLVREEKAIKAIQGVDWQEQQDAAEERRKRLQAEADAKARAERAKEVRSLRIREYRAMMEEVELTPELEALYEKACGQKYSSMDEDTVAKVAEFYETFIENRKAPTAEYKELFSSLMKRGAKTEGVAAAIAATPVEAAPVAVENKAAATAEAAGLTYKIQKHMKIVDEAQIERKYLSVNESAIQAAGNAYWETIKPKSPKDGAQFSAAAAKFSSWTGVPGIIFWVTKESADTGRRR